MRQITTAIQTTSVFGIFMALGVVVGSLSGHLALLAWATFTAGQVIYACASFRK